ncbi:MAG TPA: hypothetical protein VIZ64_00655, partial [Dokdonella sp.]
MERSFATIFVACLFAILFALVAHAAAPAATPHALRIAELPVGTDPAAAAVARGEAEADFRAIEGDRVATSAASARWFRLTLDRDWDQAEPPVLVIRDAQFARARLYVPPAYAEHLLWHEQPDLQPRFSRRASTAVLPHLLRADQPVYLRFDERPTQRRPRITVDTLAGYQGTDLRHVRLSTMFASVQFTMVLVGLCLWLALRDRVFAYFVAYAGLQLGYLLLANGEMYDLP